MSLFYADQVDLIKETRKELKKRVRAVVDKVGPKLFKNFDKMRLIMFDPESGRGSKNPSERNHGKVQGAMGRSNSFVPDTTNLNKLAQPNENLGGSFHEGDKRLSKFSKLKNDTEHSFEIGKTITDYDLDYLEELEMEKAFNVFKEAI